MNKKIILIDMDGVLADFEAGFLRAWRQKFPNLPYIPLEKRKTFHVRDDYPKELEKDVESIITSPGFFQNLPLIPMAKEAIIKMEALGYEVFICTRPISKYENCVLEKYHWIEHNLGYEWTQKLIVAKDKTLIYGDILIDDRPQHLGLKKPTWTHVLFDRPYNRNAKDKLRITWDNWEKILKSSLVT